MEAGGGAAAPPPVRRPGDLGLSRPVPGAVGLSDPERAAALLAWFSTQRRDLPWRRTRDPWAVLVAEAMLQQTQVARVVEPYRSFLAQFPDAATCAAAPLGEVVRAWEGLGYNRRAVNLHRTAVAVGDQPFPSTLEELLGLPGVGPYTARAVLAFAFERDVGVVDTNAARVLARWSGARLGPRAVQAAADAVVPPEQGWSWNQAMLDLGALVCRKRAPRCGECPVAARCAWAAAGRPEPDPAVRTAGVSTPQGTFHGSDRQGRGRLVDALRRGPVPTSGLAVVMGWPDHPARAERVAAGLVADGLVVHAGDDLRLP